MREEVKHFDLETGLTTLAEALAREAVLSAREILKSPFLVRGGPWSHPQPLSSFQRAEAKRVAKCESPEEVVALCTDGRSALARHMANVSFKTNSPDGVQRVVLRTSNRSGTPGNQMRRTHLWEGRYEEGDEFHLKAHRGVDVKERRELETSKRASRAKTVCFVREGVGTEK